MTTQNYTPADDRYNAMQYERAGSSGILLPRISLGLWQNFGASVPFSQSRSIILHAFDRGIVSFDLANNYGQPYGSAEETLGHIMRRDLRPYRDEMFIATKAGYDMWPGPYGNWGSRKYLVSSLDQSLRRMSIDYVDIFYSHRFDPDTPLRETLQTLVDIVRAGKALYVGISRWPAEAMKFAIDYLSDHDTPCLLFQDRLNIFDRATIDSRRLNLARDNGIGFVAFSTLAEGLLTSKYLNGIPDGSRAARHSHLRPSDITPQVLAKISALCDIAARRGESLARMATAWVLNQPGVTSVIAGCSSSRQLDETISAITSPAFTDEELRLIDDAASKK